VYCLLRALDSKTRLAETSVKASNIRTISPWISRDFSIFLGHGIGIIALPKPVAFIAEIFPDETFFLIWS